MHKTRWLFVLPPLLLLGCFKEPSVALRVDCGSDNNQGARVTINGEFKGECPVDMMVRDGELLVEARLNKEDLSYRYGKTKLQLAENSMKKISLNMETQYPEPYWYRRAKDIGGMEDYLKEMPQGEHAGEIAVKLEQAYFDGATGIPSMHTYLERQPNGKHRAEIESRLEQQYFDTATTLEGMYTYLEKQPNGKRHTEVEAKLEQAYFADTTTLKGMYTYLDKLPTGTRRNEVKNKINAIFTPKGFRDNFDGTVTQISNGLQWMRCSLGQTWSGYTCSGKTEAFNWNEAKSAADNTNYAGKSDWRLPTRDELFDLVYCNSGQRDSERGDHKGACKSSKEPTIMTEIFPMSEGRVLSIWAWTSTSYIGKENVAWTVCFQNTLFSAGFEEPEYKQSRYIDVRLVRAGQ